VNRAAAFARARRFLNYFAAAKWAAHGAAAATGILYVALLVVLGLFADLMVNRGRVPAFRQLAPAEQAQFEQSLAPLTEDAELSRQRLRDIYQTLAELGVETPPSAKDAKQPNELQLPPPEQVWFTDVVRYLKEHVGDESAEAVREQVRENVKQLGVAAAMEREVDDCGVLSLVVHSRNSYVSGPLNFLASWNGWWMWQAGNTAYLLGLLVVSIVLVVLRAALMFVNYDMAARATIEATTRLRRAIYHHTYRLGTLAFRALGPSEAVGISTRHLEAVHDGLFYWLTVQFRESIKFGLLLILALLVNFWLALAFLMFALLVWLIGGQVAAGLRQQGRVAGHRAANQLALIQESIMLMRLVKVYLMELFNQRRVERQLARYAAYQMHRFRGEAIYGPLLVLLGMLATLFLLYVAGNVVLNGQLSVAGGIVMATALVSLYWPLAHWLEDRRMLRRGRTSAVTLFEFLDRQGSVGQVVEAEFLPGLARQLEFDNVTLQEPGTGRKLLQGVTLTIQAGRRVAIVGPEDMEKHALVYLIPRFLDPNSGEIRIDGKNLRWVTLDSLRAQIAIVLQHNLVFNDTVANNIGCGDSGFTLPRIVEAAKIAHAHQFILKLPQGYDTPIGEQGHSLRIGQQFRIALARAILRDPALMIIEEPHTPLDDDTKALLDDTFSRVLAGRTTIFLPHRLSTIRSCDRVFLLVNGRIEAVGEHKELLAQNDLYRHLQYLEFNEFAGMSMGGSVYNVDLAGNSSGREGADSSKLP
jgi:ATP-binding cassette subfamily B protein